MSSPPPRRRGRALAAALLLLAAVPAGAQTVQITRLSDVTFGALPMDGSDQIKSQSVCAYSGLFGGRYSVSATGSGAGNAFTLANGAATLPYEVQWSGSAGQTSGAALTVGGTLPGQTMLLSCSALNPVNASLIVLVRGAAILQARAGDYSGTLTILLSPN